MAATARQRQVVRYADDVIVTGATQAVLHHQIRPAIEAFLKQRGLELSDEKNQVTHTSQGFDFHGQNLPKYAGNKQTRKIEKAKAQLRAKVEHPFRVIKRQFSYTKVRFRGLAKNAAQMVTLLTLSNLWMARRQLLASAGEVHL